MTAAEASPPEETPKGMHRRLFVILGALGLGSLGGAAWVGSRDPKAFVIALIREALPGVRIDETSARVFAQDFMDEFYRQFSRSRWAQRLMSTVKLHGAEAVRGVAGAGLFLQGGPFEAAAGDMLRRALTRFLMNSNYFQLADPTVEPVIYTSPASEACSNPFADLHPPSAADVTPWH